MTITTRFYIVCRSGRRTPFTTREIRDLALAAAEADPCGPHTTAEEEEPATEEPAFEIGGTG